MAIIPNRLDGQFSADTAQVGFASKTILNEGQIVCDNLTTNTLHIETLVVDTLDAHTVDVGGNLSVIGTSDLGDVNIIGDESNAEDFTLTGNFSINGNIACNSLSCGPNYSFVVTNGSLTLYNSSNSQAMSNLATLGIPNGYALSFYRVELLYTPNGTPYVLPDNTNLILGMGDTTTWPHLSGNSCYIGGPMPLNGFIDNTNTTKNSLYVAPQPDLVTTNMTGTTQTPMLIRDMIGPTSATTLLFVATTNPFTSPITGLGGNLTINLWWNVIQAPYN